MNTICTLNRITMHMNRWGFGALGILLALMTSLSSLQAAVNPDPCTEPFTCLTEPELIGVFESGPSQICPKESGVEWTIADSVVEGSKQKCDESPVYFGLRYIVWTWKITGPGATDLDAGEGKTAIWFPTQGSTAQPGQYTIVWTGQGEHDDPDCTGTKSATVTKTFNIPAPAATCEIPSKNICPGMQMVVPFEIVNTTDECCHEMRWVVTDVGGDFTIELLPETEGVVCVEPGEPFAGTVSLNVDAGAKPSQKHTIHLQVYSTVTGELLCECDGILVIDEAATVDVESVSLCPGEEIEVPYTIRNDTDCPWNFTWEASVDGDPLPVLVAIDANNALLQGKETHEGIVTISIPPGFPGGAGRVTIKAQMDGGTQIFEGTGVITVHEPEYGVGTRPEGTMTFDTVAGFGVYRSAGKNFSGPGETTRFTCAPSDKDTISCESEETENVDDTFLKEEAVRWTVGPNVRYGLKTDWIAPPTGGERIDCHLIDDGLYYQDLESYQFVDNIFVFIFYLDGASDQFAAPVQPYDSSNKLRTIWAHSLGQRLTSSATTPLLRYEMILINQGGEEVLDTKESAGPFDQFTIPGPGRYKFKITDVVRGNSAYSPEYVWYGLVSVTPSSFEIAYNPDLTYNDGGKIEARLGEWQNLAGAVMDGAATVQAAAEIYQRGRETFRDWDRVVARARANPVPSNPFYTRLLGYWAVIGVGLDIRDFLQTPDVIQELGDRAVEGRDNARALRPVIRALEANPRSAPGATQVEVVTIPGGITLDIVQRVNDWKTRDGRFSTEKLVDVPSSVTTDGAGHGQFAVSALGNLGMCTLNFDIEGKRQTKSVSILVSGLTQEEAMGAARTYIDGLKARINLLITTLRTGALAILVAGGLFLLLGLSITLTGGTILLFAAAMVGILSALSYAVENSQSPLMRSIRANYPQGGG